MSRLPIVAVLAGCSLLALSDPLAGAADRLQFRSHPAMRPLPAPSQRPLEDGPTYFVDAAKGDDRYDGTQARPWRTIAHGAGRLKPGETLCLRGGTYYEPVVWKVAGTAGRPVTLRAFPGELAIIDAGHRDFFEQPQHAWEPAPEGAEGEFRSTKSYEFGGGFGNFGDSMVPFHRYMNFFDLRSHNELHRTTLNDRAVDPVGMYAGPGTYRDPQTGRIHIRLAHTRLAGLGEHHYRGETDPRKLPLVIAGHDFGLRLEGARHVRIWDVVVRGAQRSAVSVENAEQVELGGVTLYGSGSALRIGNTRGLRLLNSALRGHAAPWHSRFHHKNRAGSGYLLAAAGIEFEFAHCQFTDHHDAILLKDADRVRFHHNFVDNFNDDGLEPGPKKPVQHMLIYQNVIARCLNPFTAHGEKTDPIAGEPGSGVFVYRNLVDLRRGTYKSPPAEPDPSGAFLNEPTTLLCHDHGSPTQPDYYVYHNTFLLGGDAFRDYYAWTWGAHTRGSVRRVFNNIFVQVQGLPGLNVTAISTDDDFQSDGNLFWGVLEGPKFEKDFFAAFRRSPAFEASKTRYQPGWGAHDLFVDPRFVSLGQTTGPASLPRDVRLQPDSPAVDAGVDLPADWPDPLRDRDQGRPDLGAVPLGVSD